MRRAASRASSSAAFRRMLPSITSGRSPSLGWPDARARLATSAIAYGMLTRHRGAADQAGFLAGNEERRDRLEQPLVGGVRLEGGAELRLVEQRSKTARHPAGDVDAAPRPAGEREGGGQTPRPAHGQSARPPPRRLAGP